VQRYLSQQKEHHQNISFRDEFILFLKANGIEYDERYLWPLRSPAAQAFRSSRPHS